MSNLRLDLGIGFGVATAVSAVRAEGDYFPPPEAQGGWRALVAANQAATDDFFALFVFSCGHSTAGSTMLNTNHDTHHPSHR